METEEGFKFDWLKVTPEVEVKLRKIFDKNTDGIRTMLAKGITEPPFSKMLELRIITDDFEKVDRAWVVYTLSKYGGKVGELCYAYQISQAYFRSLRQVKKSEWDLKLIEFDETRFRFEVEQSATKPEGDIFTENIIFFQVVSGLNMDLSTKEQMDECFNAIYERDAEEPDELNASSSISPLLS